MEMNGVGNIDVHAHVYHRIKYHVESFFVNLDDALDAIKKDAQAPPDRKLFSYYD